MRLVSWDRRCISEQIETVTGAMWGRATVTLQRLAALGEREGRVFTLENLNLAVDHPGTPFARAEDTLALVSAVDSPGLRMNLDLYHAQIGEGNLIELCRRALHWRGDTNARASPGRADGVPGYSHATSGFSSYMSPSPRAPRPSVSRWL